MQRPQFTAAGEKEEISKRRTTLNRVSKCLEFAAGVVPVPLVGKLFKGIRMAVQLAVNAQTNELQCLYLCERFDHAVELRTKVEDICTGDVGLSQAMERSLAKLQTFIEGQVLPFLKKFAISDSTPRSIFERGMLWITNHRDYEKSFEALHSELDLILARLVETFSLAATASLKADLAQVQRFALQQRASIQQLAQRVEDIAKDLSAQVTSECRKVAMELSREVEQLQGAWQEDLEKIKKLHDERLAEVNERITSGQQENDRRHAVLRQWLNGKLADIETVVKRSHESRKLLELNLDGPSQNADYTKGKSIIANATCEVVRGKVTETGMPYNFKLFLRSENPALCRVKLEATLLLADHQCVVQYFGQVFRKQKFAGVVSDPYNDTLQTCLDNPPSLEKIEQELLAEARQALPLFRTIGTALQSMHEKKMTHLNLDAAHVVLVDAISGVNGVAEWRLDTFDAGYLTADRKATGGIADGERHDVACFARIMEQVLEAIGAGSPFCFFLPVEAWQREVLTRVIADCKKRKVAIKSVCECLDLLDKATDSSICANWKLADDTSVEVDARKRDDLLFHLPEEESLFPVAPGSADDDAESGAADVQSEVLGTELAEAAAGLAKLSREQRASTISRLTRKLYHVLRSENQAVAEAALAQARQPAALNALKTFLRFASDESSRFYTCSAVAYVCFNTADAPCTAQEPFSDELSAGRFVAVLRSVNPAVKLAASNAIFAVVFNNPLGCVVYGSSSELKDELLAMTCIESAASHGDIFLQAGITLLGEFLRYRENCPLYSERRVIQTLIRGALWTTEEICGSCSDSSSSSSSSSDDDSSSSDGDNLPQRRRVVVGRVKKIGEWSSRHIPYSIARALSKLMPSKGVLSHPQLPAALCVLSQETNSDEASKQIAQTIANLANAEHLTPFILNMLPAIRETLISQAIFSQNSPAATESLAALACLLRKCQEWSECVSGIMRLVNGGQKLEISQLRHLRELFATESMLEMINTIRQSSGAFLSSAHEAAIAQIICYLNEADEGIDVHGDVRPLPITKNAQRALEENLDFIFHCILVPGQSQETRVAVSRVLLQQVLWNPQAAGQQVTLSQSLSADARFASLFLRTLHLEPAAVQIVIYEVAFQQLKCCASIDPVAKKILRHKPRGLEYGWLVVTEKLLTHFISAVKAGRAARKDNAELAAELDAVCKSIVFGDADDGDGGLADQGPIGVLMICTIAEHTAQTHKDGGDNDGGGPIMWESFQSELKTMFAAVMEKYANETRSKRRRQAKKTQDATFGSKTVTVSYTKDELLDLSSDSDMALALGRMPAGVDLLTDLIISQQGNTEVVVVGCCLLRLLLDPAKSSCRVRERVLLAVPKLFSGNVFTQRHLTGQAFVSQLASLDAGITDVIEKVALNKEAIVNAIIAISSIHPKHCGSATCVALLIVAFEMPGALGALAAIMTGAEHQDGSGAVVSAMSTALVENATTRDIVLKKFSAGDEGAARFCECRLLQLENCISVVLKHIPEPPAITAGSTTFLPETVVIMERLLASRKPGSDAALKQFLKMTYVAAVLKTYCDDVCPCWNAALPADASGLAILRLPRELKEACRLRLIELVHTKLPAQLHRDAKILEVLLSMDRTEADVINLFPPFIEREMRKRKARELSEGLIRGSTKVTSAIELELTARDLVASASEWGVMSNASMDSTRSLNNSSISSSSFGTTVETASFWIDWNKAIRRNERSKTLQAATLRFVTGLVVRGGRASRLFYEHQSNGITPIVGDMMCSLLERQQSQRGVSWALMYQLTKIPCIAEALWTERFLHLLQKFDADFDVVDRESFLFGGIVVNLWHSAVVLGPLAPCHDPAAAPRVKSWLDSNALKRLLCGYPLCLWVYFALFRYVPNPHCPACQTVVQKENAAAAAAAQQAQAAEAARQRSMEAERQRQEEMRLRDEEQRVRDKLSRSKDMATVDFADGEDELQIDVRAATAGVKAGPQVAGRAPAPVEASSVPDLQLPFVPSRWKCVKCQKARVWEPDAGSQKCHDPQCSKKCTAGFRHHCRGCGFLFCSDHTSKAPPPADAGFVVTSEDEYMCRHCAAANATLETFKTKLFGLQGYGHAAVAGSAADVARLFSNDIAEQWFKTNGIARKLSDAQVSALQLEATESIAETEQLCAASPAGLAQTSFSMSRNDSMRR